VWRDGFEDDGLVLVLVFGNYVLILIFHTPDFRMGVGQRLSNLESFGSM